MSKQTEIVAVVAAFFMLANMAEFWTALGIFILFTVAYLKK